MPESPVPRGWKQKKTWNNHSVNVCVRRNESLRFCAQTLTDEGKAKRSSTQLLQLLPPAAWPQLHRRTRHQLGARAGGFEAPWHQAVASGRRSVPSDRGTGCLNKLCCRRVFLKPCHSCKPTASCVPPGLAFLGWALQGEGEDLSNKDLNQRHPQCE